MPARRAVERNHEAVIGWMKGAWPQGMTAAALGAWLVFEDEAGFSMAPPKARTWSGAGSPRSSVSGVIPQTHLRSRPCLLPARPPQPADLPWPV